MQYIRLNGVPYKRIDDADTLEKLKKADALSINHKQNSDRLTRDTIDSLKTISEKFIRGIVISAEAGSLDSKAKVALMPLEMGNDVFKFVFRITLNFNKKAIQSNKTSDVANKTKSKIVKDMKMLGAKNINIATKDFDESKVVYSAVAIFDYNSKLGGEIAKDKISTKGTDAKTIKNALVDAAKRGVSHFATAKVVDFSKLKIDGDKVAGTISVKVATQQGKHAQPYEIEEVVTECLKKHNEK